MYNDFFEYTTYKLKNNVKNKNLIEQNKKFWISLLFIKNFIIFAKKYKLYHYIII